MEGKVHILTLKIANSIKQLYHIETRKSSGVNARGIPPAV